MEKDDACRVTMLFGDTHTHARRFSRGAQRRRLGDSLARSPVESLARWNRMYDCELGAAVAAENKCVLERGLRRSREIDGAENASGSGHSDLLQEDGRRGVTSQTVARFDAAR
jgi:hypothetical protein